jgi:branched-chain amino acid aminotransferase
MKPINVLELPAWQNDRFCTVEEIKLPVVDLGFIHCDSTYDAIATRNGHFVNLHEHLDRFFEGAKKIRIDIALTREQIIDIFGQLYSQSPLDESIIFIVVTRGVATKGPRDLVTPVPNLFMFVRPYAQFANGNTARVCLAKTIRNDSIDQTVKNFAWNDLTMAQLEANDRGYDSSILLSRTGVLTEGPAFNVALIKDGAIRSPANVRLTGTVMEQVRRYCEAHGISFTYCDISPAEMFDADAVFLSSTGGNVVTVTEFEGHHYGSNDLLEVLRKNIC